MSLSINDVVNVQILQSGQGATKRDFSIAAIFTKEMCEEFASPDARYVTVSNADDVANLFGTNSDAYKASQAFFSAVPKPRKALIAKYVKDGLTTEAVSSKIIGSTANTSYIKYKEINDGCFSFVLDGEVINVESLDFSLVSSLSDVATVINEAMLVNEEDSISIIFDNVGERFILASDKKGAGKNFGYVFDSQLDGSYIGAMLNLTDGRGTIINGQDSQTFKKESPVEALVALNNVNSGFYGAYFSNTLTDGELEEAHDWIVAADKKVMAVTAVRMADIEYTDSNIYKKLFKKNSGRLMVQYNNTGNVHAAAELLGIAITTIWNGVNTAKTVKFKSEKSVQSDDRITANEAAKCRRMGINFYTDYSSVNMLAEGTMLGGVFIDETTGLDAFADALQVQAFNKLQGSPTKIPQTDRGQQILIDSLKVVGEQFKTNGFLGLGRWSKGDVGELMDGDQLDGYYFYSESFDVQDQSDREARKMMPIMVAAKLAGAGHFADIIIAFNR